MLILESLFVLVLGVKSQVTRLRPDPCRYFVCQNGGLCISPAEWPYCICQPGYLGDRCEMKEISHTNICPPVTAIDCFGFPCTNDFECSPTQNCCVNKCGFKTCISPPSREVISNRCDVPCPEGYRCEVRQQECPPGIYCSPVPTCVAMATDFCGGCPSGQVCIDCGIRCWTPPCPSFKCVVTQVNMCGGCPAGHTCQVSNPPCRAPPICDRARCIHPTCPPEARCIPQPKRSRLLESCPPVRDPMHISECDSEMFFIRPCFNDHECDLLNHERCCPSRCNIRECTAISSQTVK